ncbi:MAG: cytochrome b/b6 domain-containing protein [Methylocystaceae bacterium]|nr:cytochrome b/b6 domain-containing protein [Methylocystaceae bacterium]
MNAPQEKSPIIWDLPLRFFHWSMVAVVFTAAVTGYFFEEWWLDVHVYAGYALTCLLIFRLIWGFLGSYYSRFHTFPLSRNGVVTHLKNLLKGKSEQHAGHNPVGAWMIVGLLATLCLLVVSGFIVWGGQENKGPLASLIGYQFGEWGEEIHETLAGILMFAISIHLLGVLVETFIFKHPIVQAMITGRKEGVSATGKPVSIWHSLAGMLILIGVGAAFSYWITTKQQPPMAMSSNETYQQECGDCHPAYHPSLRSQNDWQQIMNNLSDHYGEDASLDATTYQEITAFLNSQNANTFDTEVAHKVGRHDTPNQRMTQTRYWQKKHDELTETDYSHPDIGSKVNCNACHKDADSGRFDDDQIKLPKGVHS